jgi:hypothetical protein
MALDGLLAEEQLGGDLPVALAGGDESGHLDLAAGQAQIVGPGAPPSAGHSAAQASQLACRLVGEAQRPVLREVGLRTPEDGDGLADVGVRHRVPPPRARGNRFRLRNP